ncbi:MAG TPA: PKD domain-containing protein, partial [Bacteroidia bacterium]|nr:PKD domain-containing protein [Bacteroidia bacterium]
WTFGDGSTASIASPVHTYINTCSYQATLTAMHCSTSHSITHTVNVSSVAAIPNINQQQLINCYPNPADKFMWLKLNKHLLDQPYCITDLNGKTLLMGMAIDLNIKIDIEHLTEGIYILKMGNNAPQKFSIIRR